MRKELIWQKRPELQWCPGCGLNANVESADREIGPIYLCLYCGSRFPCPFSGDIPTKEQPEIREH